MNSWLSHSSPAAEEILDIRGQMALVANCGAWRSYSMAIKITDVMITAKLSIDG